MKIKAQFILINVLCLISIKMLISCNTTNRTHNLNANQKKTGDEQCDFIIEFFNKKTTEIVLRKIKKAKENNKWSDELESLYPDARDAWNESLELITNNYQKEDWSNGKYKKLSEEQLKYWTKYRHVDPPIANESYQTLENYQLFFLMLTEAATGPYPNSLHDMAENIGWLEQADMKLYLDRLVYTIFNERCDGIPPSKIIGFLKPEKLPVTIE